MKTVLIVESVDDQFTQERHEMLSSSPRLLDFKIDYCYVADHENAPFDLDEDILFGKIANKILRFGPNFVLLHTGIAFRQNPYIFFNVFKRLKGKFGNVFFGYQKREISNIEIDSSAFDNDSQTINMENLLFFEIFGRKDVNSFGEK